MVDDRQDGPNPIDGPLGEFLDSSTDLGPTREGPVQIIVALKDSTRPRALFEWAEGHRLSVRWGPDDNFAYVEGKAADVGHAFGVAIHDYRSEDGQVFFAARCNPVIPAAVGGEVTDLGRILSYNPIHRA